MVLVAAAAFAACGKSGPTTVESITIARDDGSGKAGDAVESLKPTDHEFHASIKFDKGNDVKVKADLIAVDTPEGKNINVLTQDYDLGGINNTVDLKCSLPRDWPAGSYRIDVSLDGKLAKSKEFKIEG
jgi:hypothetical protein